jgi:hypothetical protein
MKTKVGKHKNIHYRIVVGKKTAHRNTNHNEEESPAPAAIFIGFVIH